MLYAGFISYSHSVDNLYAPALQSALHRFAKPFYRLRALRIFRDQTDLSINPALWPLIEKALDESEYFLLLASPKAAKSRWVKREIDHWIQSHQGSLDRLLIVWTEGELIWDHAANDFDWDKTDALPRVLDWDDKNSNATVLQNRFKEQPFHLDQRWAKKDEDLSLRNPRFLDEIATLAATLHGKLKGDMIGDDVYEHRKYRRARMIAGVLLLTFTFLASGFGVYANRERKRAEGALQVAEERRVREEQQREIAQQKTIEANQREKAEAEARKEADRQKVLAEEQKQEAVKQQHRAEAQTLIAEDRRKEAERERNIALSRELAASARSELPNDPALSVRLAKQGLEKANSSQAETALRLSLAESQVRLILPGPTEVVRAVYSQDGKLVATAYADGTAAIWDASTGSRKLVVSHHLKALNSIAFSPDGNLLVTASEDKTAAIWNVQSGDMVAPLEGHSNGVSCAVFSPDNKLVVTASSDGMRVWNAATGSLSKQFGSNTQKGGTNSIAFSHDGRFLLTTHNGVALIWQTTDWTQFQYLSIGSFKDVMSGVFSSNDKYVLTSSSDGLARVWETKTAQIVFTLSLSDREKELVHKVSNAPRGDVTAMGDFHSRLWSVASFSPDDQLIATADDRRVRVWDATTGKTIQELNDGGFQITGASFSPNSKHVVTGDINNTVRVFGARTGVKIAELHGHDDVITGVQFDPDGQRVLTASADHTARIWEFGLGKPKIALTEHKGGTYGLSYSPNGKFIVTIDSEAKLRTWDANSGKRLALIENAFPAAVTFSADSKRLFTANLDETASSWDVLTGKKFFDLEGRLEEISLTLAISSDGSLIAAPAKGWATVLIWDARTGKQICKTGLTGGTSALAFSQNGKYLVTNGQDRVRLWDSHSGQLLKELPIDDEIFGEVRFSPDDKSIVVSSSTMIFDPLTYYSTTRIWDVATGQTTVLSERSPRRTVHMSFSPDSKYLLTASHDGFLRVWELRTGNVVYSGQNLNGVVNADFSLNGKFILIARNDGMVRVLDLNSKESFLLFNRHDNPEQPAYFSPNGKYVLTSSSDGTALIFECEACGTQNELLELAKSRALPRIPERTTTHQDPIQSALEASDPSRLRAIIRLTVDQIILDSIDSDEFDDILIPETRIENLGLDAQALSKLFKKFSEKLGVAFPETEVGKLETVADVNGYIEVQLRKRRKSR